MKKRNIVLLVIFLFLIFSGLIVGGVYLARRFFTTPLNPTLDLVTPTPVAISPTATQQEVTEEPSLTCSGDGLLKLLQIGIVPPLEQHHKGADAIRFVVVDYDQVQVRVLAIPADLWLPTPSKLVEELGQQSPLNLIYLEAYKAADGTDQEKTQIATQELAQVLVNEFGFIPDQYMTINGDSFLDMVDTLGGIKITLPTEIDATAENYGIFPSGEITLDGEQALDFVRILYPNGAGPDNFGRFQRQNIVIKALLTAMLSPENWAKAPAIVIEVNSLVVTDLNLSQIEQLACMLGEIGDETEQLAVSKDMVTIDNQNHMIPDIDAIIDLIDQLED